MPTIQTYNQDGKAAGDMTLDEQVFGVKENMALVHQVYHAIFANARKPWAHTKDRGDVSGGGKKPWKQKGTGRARHGSIRSPIWRGGGITFGPLKDRNYHQRINKKMKQQAVAVCLSQKVRNGQLIVVDMFPTDGKTKSITAQLKNLPLKRSSALVLVSKKADELARGIRNMSHVSVDLAAHADVADLLQHTYIITTKDGIKALEKRFA